MADVWSALSDPLRRQMLLRLASGERTAGEVADGLDVSQPGASKHLRVLREAGLVTVRGDAQRRIYALDREPLGEVGTLLSLLLSSIGDVGPLLDALHTEVARGRRTRRATPQENTA